MLAALIEGAGGIEDASARYQEVRLSPRWSYADDVQRARVVARYAASNGYVAYRWARTGHGLTLDFTGAGRRTTLRLLLPEGVRQIARLRLDGRPHTYATEEIYGSRYITLEAGGSGRAELEW
jgi:hypothetical protein